MKRGDIKDADPCYIAHVGVRPGLFGFVQPGSSRPNHTVAGGIQLCEPFTDVLL